MKGLAFLLFIFVFFCSGCDLQKKEDELEKREVALNQREQNITTKENDLEKKEQALKLREEQIDSTAKKDTARFYNPAMIGTWLVKMTCTETTCTGSAIGDTKTEQ